MDKKMSKAVESFIADYAEGCGVTREEFIENSIVDLMARVHIRSLMRVGNPFGPLMHLIKLDGRLLHDQELFNWLVEYYDEDLQITALAEMDREAEAKAYMEEFKSNGEVLTQDQLDKRGKKLLREEAQRHEERGRLQEQIDKGNVPADYNGSAYVALEWVDEYYCGDISKAQLAERFAEHAKHSGWGKDHEE